MTQNKETVWIQIIEEKTLFFIQSLVKSKLDVVYVNNYLNYLQLPDLWRAGEFQNNFCWKSEKLAEIKASVRLGCSCFCFFFAIFIIFPHD